MTYGSYGAWQKKDLLAASDLKREPENEPVFQRIRRDRIRLRIRRCWTLMSTLPPAPTEGEQRRI